jgi:hypothetical protein
MNVKRDSKQSFNSLLIADAQPTEDECGAMDSTMNVERDGKQSFNPSIHC